MKVLLDTQVLITAYMGASLPENVRSLLADPATDRFLCAASIMEISLKRASGKLLISEPQVREAERDLCVKVLPFTSEHAYHLFSLPLHHRDPFDRMIIATALAEKLPLVGSDREFRKCRGLKVIWGR